MATNATTQSLLNDPTFQGYLARVQQLVAQLKSPTAQNKADIVQQLNVLQGQADDYAHSKGVPNGYTWDFNSNQVVEEDFARRHPFITAGLLGAGAVAAPVAYAALPAAGSAAGADAGATTAGTAGTTAAADSVLPATATVPTTGSLAAGGTGLAGVDTSLAGGTAAGTSAATTAAAGSAGGSIWKQILLGGAIPAAASLGGAAIAASASTKAAQIQAGETDKQLAQAKEIYEQERADEAPYRQAGGYSLNALNYGLGLPTVDLNPAPTTSGASGASGPTTTTKGGQVLPARTQPAGSPTLGTAVPRTQAYSTNTLNAIGGNSGTTRMQAPNGNIYLVPNADVAARIQDGGQVVG